MALSAYGFVAYLATYALDTTTDKFMNFIRIPTYLLLLGLLGACSVGPTYHSPTPALTSTWQAPLPHDGQISHLDNWWAQYHDATLVKLIEQAQASSPNLDSAIARIAQARANGESTGAGLFPTLDFNAKSIRSKSTPFGSQVFLQTANSVSLDSAWEIDLFGASRRAREAAVARYDARVANWHEARVSLAAEVASTYFTYRACEIAAGNAAADWQSRQQTAALTQLKLAQQFIPASDAALAMASTQDAHNRYLNQQAECASQRKSLVALTGWDEPALITELGQQQAKLPDSPMLNINSVPADILRQRPDLAAAERDLSAAMADIGIAEANRYPRISLTGSIGISWLNLNGASSQSDTWSFGPALNIPLFDAGKRRANAALAQAKYDEARANYELKVRSAVKETEQALVQLDSTRLRLIDALASVNSYSQVEHATQLRYQAGTASLLEVEDSKRNLINAQNLYTTLQRDQLTASISLYKAMGGGYTSADKHD
ncbi:MAG: efflux transporter outer membrane subunit [Sulfuriferula sp.]